MYFTGILLQIQSSPGGRMNALLWLCTWEEGLFEIQRWTVRAKPFCLSSLKQKNATVNPGEEESGSEHEVTWRGKPTAADAEGKKK